MSHPVNVSSLADLQHQRLVATRHIPRAAVIGLGVIGRAQCRMLSGAGYELVTYDITEGRNYPLDEIARCDFAMVAVGTPSRYDGSADMSYVRAALADLPSMPVVIRSTMPPGSTANMQRLFALPYACHAPEFMHEREGGAWQESSDVPFLILGGDEASRDYFRPYFAGLFPKVHECSSLVAELAKYTVNLHLAARVTFINEMDGICRAAGADWEDVRQAWLCDPRITPEYTGGITEFGPGFGGRCWPKDLSALIAATAEHSYDALFLKDVQAANDRFRA